mgnify:CR=1 FL=1
MPGSEPPAVVAVVKFSNGVSVQGYVTAPREQMRIDMSVRSVAAPIPGSDEPGYAFEPTDEVADAAVWFCLEGILARDR